MLTNQIFHELEAPLRRTFEVLLKALNPPADAPGFAEVFLIARDCCFIWVETLPFGTKQMNELLLQIDTIAHRIEEFIPAGRHEGSTMHRRLSKFPAWGMLLEMREKHGNRELMAGIGAALMFALAQERKLPKELCISVRKCMKSSSTGAVPDQVKFHLLRAHKRACKFFLSGSVTTLSLEDEVKFYFANRNYFATDRNHQGLADHRAQSNCQMLDSAEKIRQGVEAGVHDDILIALSFCCGLPMRITARLPLVDMESNEVSVGVDLARGDFLIDLRFLTPNHAVSDGSAQNALIQADEVLVKPLPQFLANALRILGDQLPHAISVGDLLLHVDTSPYRILLDEGEVGNLKPTVTRFRNGAGPFALELGLERILAAHVSGDYRLVPRGRMYYVAVDLDAFHEGCNKFYASLGWGEPVSLASSGRVGSQIVPTDETIQKLAVWMDREVRNSSPGRHSSNERLITHHNTFAKATTSIAVFCLLLRQRKVFPIQASDLSEGFDFIELGDKLVGQHPGKDLIPVCSLFRSQLKFYFWHLETISRRLEKLSPAESDGARIHIAAVLNRQSASLFFMLGPELQVIPIGSNDLLDWWPEEFSLESNFGRHFWQTHAIALKINNLELDALVRHSQRGNLAWSAGSLLSVTEWAEKIRSAMDSKIMELSIEPIPGIVLKGRS